MGLFNFLPTPRNEPVSAPILETSESLEHTKYLAEFADKWKSLDWNARTREVSARHTYVVLRNELEVEMSEHHITVDDCKKYLGQKVRELH